MSYSIYSIFLSTASRGQIPDTATAKNKTKIKMKTEMKTEKKTEKRSAKKKRKIKKFQQKIKNLKATIVQKILKFIETPNLKIISNEMKSHQIKLME
jgi:hypothetical protein